VAVTVAVVTGEAASAYFPDAPGPLTLLLTGYDFSESLSASQWQVR
jgi:hypothetical protein